MRVAHRTESQSAYMAQGNGQSAYMAHRYESCMVHRNE